VRLLLDTHVLLWWLADDRRLKAQERRAIANREALVYVSAVSIWEIAIKKRLGRLEVDTEVLGREIEHVGMTELPVRWRHSKATAALPRHHDDPFDLMLIAQAQAEGLTVVTYDRAFEPYDVALLPSV
jgi:PIN domain nuclease of toxin-antitoxin system